MVDQQQQQVVVVNVHAQKRTNGLGVAALVLGILACLTAWIPIIGLVSIPVAVLGLVFGGIGFLISLVGRRSSLGMPISGIIICIVALVLQVAVTGGTIGVTKAIDDAEREAASTRPASHK